MSLFSKARLLISNAARSLRRSSSALLQAVKTEHEKNQRESISSLVAKGAIHRRTAAKLMANALADQKGLRGYERTLFRRNFLRRYAVSRTGHIVVKSS